MSESVLVAPEPCITLAILIGGFGFIWDAIPDVETRLSQRINALSDRQSDTNERIARLLILRVSVSESY